MQSITFITNLAKNTLEYAKLLLHSLKTNLDDTTHQILVFIDSDNENLLEYLLSIKSEFHDLTIIKNNLNVPLGNPLNQNILTSYAKYDLISYLQSDMIVGPHYDTEILKYAKKGRILSSTRVEPPLHGNSPVTITKNLGLRPSEFSFSDWNSFAQSAKKDDVVNFFFSPITYYKEDWATLGGYDTMFRRARDDSDLVQRCLHAGIEILQTFSANVYHFTCVSSRGKDWFDNNNTEAQQRVFTQNQADNIEIRRFVRKWGNFNHGDSKLHKLDIDLVVKNCNNLQSVYNIEPFFNKVWVETEEHKKELLTLYASQHDPANILWGFTDDDWAKYKHLYHVENVERIFSVGEPTQYHTKVTIDFKKVTNPNQFLSNLQNMYDMLKDCEPGEYELDNISVVVNEIQVLPVVVQAENPEFDNSILTVY